MPHRQTLALQRIRHPSEPPEPPPPRDQKHIAKRYWRYRFWDNEKIAEGDADKRKVIGNSWLAQAQMITLFPL